MEGKPFRCNCWNGFFSNCFACILQENLLHLFQNFDGACEYGAEK
ncbi:hypothetical protein B4168_0777 [Anoxybacillus flavithermus]|nr:hypothetical protein B4168_0777 [Anoxybacillus flavithermus]OAO86785.1 hypothetical protein GT23_1803 [Parageobacillus thermoglucosidasius]